MSDKENVALIATFSMKVPLKIILGSTFNESTIKNYFGFNSVDCMFVMVVKFPLNIYFILKNWTNEMPEHLNACVKIESS